MSNSRLLEPPPSYRVVIDIINHFQDEGMFLRLPEEMIEVGAIRQIILPVGIEQTVPVE